MDKTRPEVEDNAWTKRLISYGFPRAPENMDAAFVWSGNGRVYFIKGLPSSIRADYVLHILISLNNSLSASALRNSNKSGALYTRHE